MEIEIETYGLVKAVDITLDGAAASLEASLHLVLVLVELVHDVLLVKALRLLGVQEALGAEQVLRHAVQVALTTSELVGKHGLIL